MTFSVLETSIQDGQPIELYQLTRSGEAWRYTNNAQDIDSPFGDGKRYAALPMARSGIERTGEVARSEMTLTLPIHAPVTRAMIGIPPSDATTITVWQMHHGDDDPRVVWMGRVVSTIWTAEAVELKCEPVYTSLKRLGLRRMYQLNCPHMLYSAPCGVIQSQHSVAGTITETGWHSIRVPEAAAYPDRHFAGGMVAWGTEVRMIVGHIADMIQIVADPPSASTAVTLYPGCDRSLQTCSSKFFNALNFGGTPFIPKINPMNGGMAY